MMKVTMTVAADIAGVEHLLGFADVGYSLPLAGGLIIRVRA